MINDGSKKLRLQRLLPATLLLLLYTALLLRALIPTGQPVLAALDDDLLFFTEDHSKSERAAWADADADGDLDLAVANLDVVGTVRLFRNNGGGDFSAEVILDGGYAVAIAWGDVDGDGDFDLAVGRGGNGGSLNNVLLRNDGSGIFTASDIGSAANKSQAIAWGDADGDGDLDLAVANDGQHNQLYVNSGGELNARNLITGVVSSSYDISWGDADGDSDLDLAVGISGATNALYRNDGNANFSSEIISAGGALDTRRMQWGDLDKDGDADLVTANNWSNIYTFYNDGNGVFTATSLATTDAVRDVALGDIDLDGDIDIVAPSSGINTQFINDGAGNFASMSIGTLDQDSWGAVLGDADGDGDLDLAVVNGGGSHSQIDQIVRNSAVIGFDAAALPAKSEHSFDVAWGDADGDGDLDLAVANGGVSTPATNHLYRNDGRGQFSVSDLSTELNDSRSVAWGDADGDGDLDLAVGNWSAANYLLLNDGGGNFTANILAGGNPRTRSVAWGDADGDGDLDLAVGNDLDRNQILLNNGSGSFNAVDVELAIRETYAVAWGDADGDGDLDLATADISGPSILYLNDGSGLFSVKPIAGSAHPINDVAWGDADGDGDLDLASASPGLGNRIFLNDGSANFSQQLLSTDFKTSYAVAWLDADGDGDRDLVFANEQAVNQLFYNDGAANFERVDLEADADRSYSVATGDVDGDGDADIAFGEWADTKPNHLYRNHLYDHSRLISSAPQLAAVTSDTLSAADHFATSRIVNDPAIQLPFVLSDTSGSPIGELNAYYSLNGGGDWLPAVPLSTTITETLTTRSSSGHGVRHTFHWDTFDSGFFGQSDSVVIRFVAQSAGNQGIAGIYSYPNGVANSYQRAHYATMTYPFRARGTQVRVIDEVGAPISGARVLRRPSGAAEASILANSAGEAFTTGAFGYLSGRGRLDQSDELFALVPITVTQKYTVFYGSGIATVGGVNGVTVAAGGTQTLTVSTENTLMLLDLVVSLEWDASGDAEYLAQLEKDLRRSSEILFDLTNGQAALGNITVYQAGEQWEAADVVVLASNNQRPSANLGGIVSEPVDDVMFDDTPLPLAYLPGQIRMGATWNRYGNPGGALGEDWPRALAHEIGHYAFFLLDNYIGIDDDGNMIAVDCKGSAMTDAYRNDYSEFVAPAVEGGNFTWSGDCLQTVAARTTGRSDWETLRNFYPHLKSNIAAAGAGPVDLPLQVTRVAIVPPAAPGPTITDLFIYLVDQAGGSIALEGGTAQSYLIQTGQTPSLLDDAVIALGTPNGPLVEARGAAAGDRLCVFDGAGDTARQGCLDNLSPISTTLTLRPTPGWTPLIEVTPINSTTLGVTVTHQSVAGDLNVQLLPTYRPTTTLEALTATLTSVGGDRYYGELQFPITVLHGHVRVWESAGDRREMISPFFVSIGWDGNAFAVWGGNAFAIWDGNAFAVWDGNAFAVWGGNAFAVWGGNAFAVWGAPVTTPDGQVKLYRPDDVLGINPPLLLQALPAAPDLPYWLTPIGRAYRYQSAEPQHEDGLVIQFQYLQRELPTIDESALRIYYLADSADAEWRRLPTVLDTTYNFASADIEGAGVYALIATLELPPLATGWNNFSYPIGQSRPVTNALASIDGSYTSVYRYDAFAQQWLLYDATVRGQTPRLAALVNDLTTLDPFHAYWIYATEPVTPYLQVAGSARQSTLLPPAAYYGWITPTAGFQPTAGSIVSATIDGTHCGNGSVTSVGSQLAYVVHVSSETPFGVANGCGQNGRSVQFKVDDTPFAVAVPWQNAAANLHSLGAQQIPLHIGSQAQETVPALTPPMLLLILMLGSILLLWRLPAGRGH